MTTLTIEIDRAKDKELSALKEFIGHLGLKYQIEENEGLLYTDELKNELDRRYAEYQQGKEMVSAEESRKRIKNLLVSRSK
ncbi:hypothetical protein [Mucilaginibacter sp.]|uniref:hypothetical protein n=1 Tax=Mucilaginibacter sp. TaxID=1882438 RepID=UPI00283BD97B|nr:hypothetical protein [Mucilaginibacter sp.]MDR3695408.1 hypothetical protein [Mucilaginibacter sp.]